MTVRGEVAEKKRSHGAMNHPWSLTLRDLQEIFLRSLLCDVSHVLSICLQRDQLLPPVDMMNQNCAGIMAVSI
jgi:hypothetical protein